MKTILITIGLLMAVGVVIFSYAVEAVNVKFNAVGEIIDKGPAFGFDFGNFTEYSDNQEEDTSLPVSPQQPTGKPAGGGGGG